MKSNLKFTDPEFVLMCALDYVVNRHTYAPSSLAREIEAHWADISDTTKEYIKRTIKREFSTCDKSLHKILEL